MWSSNVPEDPKQPENPWHSAAADNHNGEHGATEAGSSNDSGTPDARGMWGERDTGHPNEVMALEDFEVLRKELTALSKAESQRSQRAPSLARVTSRKSLKDGHPVQPVRSRQSDLESNLPDKEKEEEAELPPEDDEDDFALDDFMREGHFEKRQDGVSAKRVGVVWKHLTVKGVGATATFVRTLPDAVMGTFGPDLYRLITRFIPALKIGSSGPMRTLLHDFTGVARPGEMLLVLGQPGAGCSTFLRTIANNRGTFASIEGEVHYGGIPADKQQKRYRGEVVYNPEDDVHFANLNVWETLRFALTNKTKKRARGEIDIIARALMKMFGITHTKYTKVGDEYTHGVSGGERKRVGIAETLATKSTVVCWDNSTRGLDASTALDYARSLRIMTDISARTTIVTLYQAGEEIYNVMDKVMLIDQGRCIYLGPASKARQYFIDLGFYAPPRQTTADYLTAVTDPNEREYREGFEGKAPKTTEELEAAFRASNFYQEMLADVDSFEAEIKQNDYTEARDFAQAVSEGKSHHVADKSSYTVSFPRQVIACTKREWWLFINDTTTLYTKIFVIIANGLIVGSLFYGESLDTSGAFSRSGALFFSIVFLGWLQLAELIKAVSGRGIIARHHEYAFYRPSAVTLARIVLDFPIILAQVIIFSIIMYFLCDLDVVASKFWIYFLFIFTTTLCITAMYRMFAALSPTIDDAVRFSGIALNLLVFYTGYVIPKTQLLSKYIWFGWLYYINPIAYSFEGVLSNELAGRVMECNPEQLVPSGPGADPAYQGCAVAGAAVNAHSVEGSVFLEDMYTYSRSHLWRNWAVVVAFFVLYALITAVCVEVVSFARGGGGALVFKKTRKAKKAVKAADAPADEETGISHENSQSSGNAAGTDNDQESLNKIARSESVFTWENVEYSVPYMGGHKKLLNGISGYAKPGVMVALMGASGAGKTTLLNTLAQRQRVGIVAGDMFVDGQALRRSFQRGTGFCEQMDLHDETSTIKEAIEFSAILRQDQSTPRAERVAYAQEVIDLLELTDIQDALISSLGVEQRKRLTIGVELAAKPQLLLFLDEPTSGLDSQSAFSIIRFLRKLSAAGQAIVCTIHQPSSVLIQQFDMILALNPGGNTFYFGPVGEKGAAVIDYFAKRGVQCAPDKNVAEFILETAIKGVKRADGTRINWNDEWRKSDENRELHAEIQRIKSERMELAPAPTKADEEASEYAASVWLQTTMLTKRVYIQYWRSPSYLYGKLFNSVIVGIFNGFTFYQLGNSTQDLQNRMFSSFLVLFLPPAFVNSILPKFYGNMALWQAREMPSRIYGWFAFTTAMILGEIPITILGSVLYFVIWYWPTGLPTESSVSGYVFLMTMLFFLFMSSWGQWICAFAPSFTVISNILPFFFVMFGLFNGVVRPYAQLSVFWRYWMYYLNPSQYWIGGVLAATLNGIPVECTSTETAHFDAPPGQTCMQYAGAFAQQAGGYLLNPNASQDCQYCPYSTGNDYLRTLHIQVDQKWRNFGIFLAFCISNYALVYFFIYTVRIRGWSFGFGFVFGHLGRLADKVKNGIARLFGLKKKQEE